MLSRRCCLELAFPRDRNLGVDVVAAARGQVSPGSDGADRNRLLSARERPGMEPILVVEGTGTGPTDTAAYDAALAAANVHNYNLVTLSSVIPEGATVEHAGTAPDLGAVGDRLAVVRARAVGRGRVAAALSWGQTPTGTGLFYEASAIDADIEGGDGSEDVDPRSVATERARRGLTAGTDLRGWTLADRDHVATSTAAGDARPACAVVLAVYGTGDPLLSVDRG